jgi:acyl carrier protein
VAGPLVARLGKGGILIKGGWVGASGGEFTSFLSADQEGDAVDAITEEVMQIISRELKIPLERLTPDTALQDLGVESLDLIEIIFALEEKFDINIPYDANEAAVAGNADSSRDGLGKLETIEQISAAVKGLMDAKTAA